MIAVNDPGQTAENAFVVVVNHEGRHALWPAGLDLPDGWRRESAAMSRRACLDAIAGAGRDSPQPAQAG